MTSPNTAPPIDFATVTAREAANAVADNGTRRIQALLERKNSGEQFPEGYVERQWDVAEHVGKYALDMVGVSTVENGLHLMGELDDRARKLNVARNDDFPSHDRLSDRTFRGNVVQELRRLGSMTLPDIIAEHRPDEPAAPPAGDTQTTRPAQAETTNNYETLLNEMLDYSDKVGGTGLYGDGYRGGLQDFKAGPLVKRLSSTPLAPTLNIWERVAPHPQIKRFREGDSSNPKNKIEPRQNGQALVEAVAYEPAVITPDRILITPGTDSTLFKKGKPPVWEYPPNEALTVEGPDGPEPAIGVAFKFHPAWVDGTENQITNSLDDRYMSPSSGRPGNNHAYIVVVPKSLADRFEDVRQNEQPDITHILGDKIVNRYAPEDYKKAWNDEKARTEAGEHFVHKTYPTYDSISQDVPVHIWDGRGSVETAATAGVTFEHRLSK